VNGQLRIEEMFAFVVMDDDDTEGVPAFLSGDLWLPMMGADMAKVEILRPLAEEVAADLGKPVTLLRFSTREEVEVIGAPHQAGTT